MPNLAARRFVRRRSFLLGVVYHHLAAATRIWRSMFENEEELAREGLRFMQAEWERRAAR